MENLHSASSAFISATNDSIQGRNETVPGAISTGSRTASRKAERRPRLKTNSRKRLNPGVISTLESDGQVRDASHPHLHIDTNTMHDVPSPLPEPQRAVSEAMGTAPRRSCEPYRPHEFTALGLASATECPVGSRSVFVEGMSEEPILGYSSATESLLERCMLDPSEFLRAITEAQLSLPDGRGWEAAIATKKNNVDLRDLTRIFHRFECYNIYQHLVDAGYHTGSHWIRDMRPVLAEKLSRDFPKHFPDPKTANKCLKWVDQGCRYREWAEKLSGPGLNLGYLMALPCSVPHSA